ncbi:MAG: SdrD B-like domain-containing protein, partial [Candidatus Krumholzibacteria bacterium]|nr:SdrD B-like domain-containing protein [Candidatus Krumholzibacteria bacterium]
DVGETGLPGVEVRLAGQNRTVITDNYGMFYFPLPAGTYSIQEVDPPGYLSTTANLVSVTIASGMVNMVNYGDYATAPTGVIMGTVFDDADMDGIKGVSEAGLPGVLISLDSGAEVKTDNAGRYSFIAPQGNYIVVETDPTGFSSTTPNSVSAAIVDMGDTVVVNFGDLAGEVYGTLEGYVFLDTNEDGARNTGEGGLPNAVIRISSGDSTRTNASGFYLFNLSPGTYSVTEVDPVGYTSTTVNSYLDIPITADTTVTRNFGDILQVTQDFVEIHISNTERVLSVTTADLREDDRRDIDIVLGTALLTGFGNMLVFQNQWESATTPITELFSPDPDYRREAGNNINAMARFDLSGDGVPDVMTGLDVSTAPNTQVWFAQSGGLLSTSPDYIYQSSGLTEVLDIRLADLDHDGRVDLILGLKSSIGGTGAFETFRGLGGGQFSHDQYVANAGAGSEFPLGEVWAIDAGDVDGDGDLDIIVGTHQTAYTGFLDVYINTGYASGVFAWKARYLAKGAVNDLILVDMMEDDANDPDLLVATSSGPNVGSVLLFHNSYGVYGVADTTGAAFPDQTMPRWPDDYVDAQGEALSLGTLRLNNDIFPDVTYGTRNSSLYMGDVFVLPAYSTLPENGTKINKTSPGEIVTIGVADFNKDGRPDIVVGTRSSATQGRLIAYFGREY